MSRYQCKALTLKGARCQNKTFYKSDRCNLHGNNPHNMSKGSLRFRMFTMSLNVFMIKMG